MKKLHSVGLICGFAGLLGACEERSGGGASDAVASGDEPSSVTILYPADDLGPAASAPIQYMVFLTLVRRTPDGGLEGRLARRWEFEPDDRGWTVHLRSDVRWQDGAPVTARDVKFTLDLYAHPDVLWAAPGSYEVQVLDDSTYSIRYADTADAELPIGSPLDWYHPIYPAHLLRDQDPADFHGWEFWKKPVGNGPYRLVRRVPETGLVLESNPDFYLGPPAIDRVVVRTGESSLIELRAGRVNAVASVPYADTPELKADGRYSLYHAYNLGSISAILWNQGRPPLDEPLVRRALTLAIDRRAILALLNAPLELEPIDVLFTEEQFRNGKLPPAVPYDPDSARTLLAAAGWVDRDGDGVRDREGEPLRFSLLVSQGGGPWFPDHLREAILIQANLRAVGVGAELMTVEPSAGWARLRRRQFDAAIIDLKPGNRSLLFGRQSIIGYRSARAAGLLAAASRELDRGARGRRLIELGEVLREDLPFTLLQPMVTWTAADRRLRGLSSPWRADPAWYVDALSWGRPAAGR